jgi:hypothetical protein
VSLAPRKGPPSVTQLGGHARNRARARRAHSAVGTVSTREQALVRAARADASSGWEAQSKVRALAALVELGEASPLDEDELRRLLEDVAHDPPAGARGAQARLAALQALERLDAPPDDQAELVRRLFDDRPDDELVAHDDWHPTGGKWRELDACHTLGKRRRWYCNLAEDGRLEEAQGQRR